HQGLR
ncbi:ig domain protein, partial [Vibrio parahaemolyticus V-223/04]